MGCLISGLGWHAIFSMILSCFGGTGIVRVHNWYRLGTVCTSQINRFRVQAIEYGYWQGGFRILQKCVKFQGLPPGITARNFPSDYDSIDAARYKQEATVSCVSCDAAHLP